MFMVIQTTGKPMICKKPAFLKYQVAAAALRKEIDHKD
jgi:hypothetical protein